MAGIAMRLVALGVLAFGTAAQASTLFRCVDAGGRVAIRETPCPPHARTSWTREVGPDDRSPAELGRLRHEQQQRMDDAKRLAAMAGTLPGMHPPRRGRALRGNHARSAPSRCDIARRHRDDVLGNRRREADYDTRRALNDEVFDACR